MVPGTVAEAAKAVRLGHPVRPRGGGTKLEWGGAIEGAEDLDTRGLDRIVEHNVGDFTAVLEAGVPLAAAQAAFAEEGQMLALDPPLGDASAATVGGVVATADSGPLRHRYGSVRDLVVGITVVLSDGTVAKAGGKVIKNVAGYDLGKLFAGSFGTLGLIASVSVRLHPRPQTTATASAASDDPARLAEVAGRLVALPLEADCLDVAWEDGAGRVLVRFGGAAASDQAEHALTHLAVLDDVTASTDDDAVWDAQRARQRGDVVVKVSGRLTDLERVLRAADARGATVVSRAAHGLSWLSLRDPSDVPGLREALAPRSCTVLDGAARVQDPWPAVAPGTLALMRRVKARFDPDGAFKPGAFVGGI